MNAPKAPAGQPAPSTHRVLFVTHTAEWIGPNASLVQLVTRSPEWMEPIVLIPGDGPLSTELQRQHIAYRLIGKLDKYAIPRIAKLIRKEEIDLVYGNSAHGASRNSMIAAKLCSRPFVYHLREMSEGKMRTVAFLRLADAVVAVSRATADSYRQFLQTPATVVYNGVPEEHFASPVPGTRTRLRDEFGIPAQAPVVVHVGNVYRRKAQHLAVETFRRLKCRHSDARLFLVGRLDRDPAYVGELEAMIQVAEHPEHIHLTGFRADVKDFLAASDVFLHTATEDPHPRAVIEAMAAGLPVVATAVDGVKETILDGQCGFLVHPPPDPDRLAGRLDRILRSPEFGADMGANGRDRARRLFSAERAAGEVACVIERLLPRRGA